MTHDTQRRFKAASYNSSYQGAMFPWESAASGEETCPAWAGTGLREIHISGDIALAVELMFKSTGSTAWLASTGFPIVSQVAEMWCSRVEPSAHDNLLHINGVIPPDEYVTPQFVCPYFV
jgi:trehalose/maltose hydrolase-like predicted phosphorylase